MNSQRPRVTRLQKRRDWHRHRDACHGCVAGRECLPGNRLRLRFVYDLAIGT